MQKKLPTQCHLFQKEHLSSEDMYIQNTFEILQTFIDDSHFRHSLLRCLQCGQLYFYEFQEEVDMVSGNDPQYSLYIPIQTEEEAKKITTMSHAELLQYSPRLHKDWPADANEPSIYWIGR